ncbi:MAG: ABC transporter permease [bacterium]|nr:ABC transporter permease [bacterium]
MKASTHIEVYRKFEGELKKRPFRAGIVALSGIRVGFRRKLPALLLYAIPAISCIVTCFLVNLRFNASLGIPGAPSGSGAQAGALLEGVLDVKLLILEFVERVRFFALLAVTWYGAGLIAEDRRLGANLLYFSRPITRFQYLLGKFLTTAFYGSCAILFPCIVVCSTAAFASPDWLFVKEEWDVILWTLAYASMWVLTLTAVVLTVSSMVERKTLALVGTFALVFLTEGASNVMSEISNEASYRLFSLTRNFQRIGEWMFGRPSPLNWNVEASFWVIGLVFTGCMLILAQRVRRMEVVA